MGAIKAVSIRALPPVWRPVPKVSGNARQARDALSLHFGGEDVHLYGSGTQALTVAIREAVGKRDPASCNVVLPAYGCPDIVTACIGAGAQPRLVDLSEHFVGYDLTDLRNSIDANTVAIVAVDLLGAGDAVDELAPIVYEAGLTLIQDWAQSLPREPSAKTGSFLILSFGRGKPLNLLGGGAVVGNVSMPNVPVLRSGIRTSGLAAAAFGLLTHPSVFGYVEAFAGKQIGTTRYKNPETPRRVEDKAPHRLPGGFSQYVCTPSYRVAPYLPHLSKWREVGVVPMSNRFNNVDCETLRLPLLARSRIHRDRLVSLLRARGLGASAMYGAPLPEVRGVPPVISKQGPFINACSLADRLFTVPTHRRVDDRVASEINEILLGTDPV